MDTVANTTIEEKLAPWLGQCAEPLWLVGGAVRDALAGHPLHDIDICVAGDAVPVARRCANMIGGTVGIIDLTGIVRVTLPSLSERPSAAPWQLDFASMQGASVEEDLRRRDFTINAMALPLTEATLPSLWQSLPAAVWDALIDPCGGRADLAARRLRLASDHALDADPVRVLRAARLATALECDVDENLIAVARSVAPQLAEMPPERILAELYAMLAQPNGTCAMRALDRLGALTVLVPPLIPCRGLQQGRLHYWDVFDHTLEVIDAVDRVVTLLEVGLTQPTMPGVPDAEGHVPHPESLDLGGQNARVLAWLRAPLAEGQTRLTMLKVAALFHDVGKPSTRGVRENGDIHFYGHAEAGVPITAPVLRGWRMGRIARRFVTSVVACHMRPGQIAGPQGLTDKAARYFFRDAGDAGIDVAVFSLADHLAVYGPRPLTRFWLAHYGAVAELVRRAYLEPERVLPARLIDGNDLIARFGLTHGPEIGRILAAVDAAQLDGTIATRAEALALVAYLLGSE